MTVDVWATALRAARENSRPVAPLTEATPDLTVDQAYAIAARNVAARVAGGARVVGHKIGLTSVAVQQQLGVGEPDYGTLLDDMEIADGGVMSLAAFIAPRVELELAFHLGAPLRGPGIGVADVQAATESVQAAIEIVDSRVADWRITLADTVADNASSGAFVLGGPRVPLRALDPADLEASFSRGRRGDRARPLERRAGRSVRGRRVVGQRARGVRHDARGRARDALRARARGWCPPRPARSTPARSPGSAT